jgi:hypothetical protein
LRHCASTPLIKLFEKVAARRKLEAELEKLAQYGKPVKKSESAPIAKVKKTEETKEPKDSSRESVEEPVVKAA